MDASMKEKLTLDEYKEIEQLVGYALVAPNKKEAQRYIDKIQLYGCNLYGSAGNIFGELVSCVKAASGSVSDKKNQCDFVESTLLKLECYGVIN